MNAVRAPMPQGQIPDHSGLWIVPRDEEQLRKDIEHQVFVKTRFYREIARVIKEAGARRVLEIGCGSTIDSCRLASQSSAEFHALDAAPSAILLARRVGRHFSGDVHLHIGDAFSSPFPDGSFDVVFHQGLLEHFEDPRPLLTENIRLLRPGGFLVVDVPQRFSLYTILKRRKMRRGVWPWGWEREYSVAEMRELATHLPMELVRISSWGYERYTALVRWPWEKLRRRGPLRRMRSFHWASRRILEPIWECPWVLVEDRLGPHFMMNVTGIYRRTR